MEFYSLNNPQIKASFKQACIQGQAADKGLFFPSSIPKWSNNFIKNLPAWSNEAIGAEIMKPFTEGDIPSKILEAIIAHTLQFNIPLIALSDRTSVLELFHGPTLAFKDIGARFMSSCLGYFLKDEKQKKVTVLVATSGDTGGAVVNGFYETPGVRVVVLYPKGKVSLVQERQICANGSNIFPIAIEGDFDDCQQMVKAAFADETLQQSLFLTSANSINVARWLPQQIYYALALKQWSNNKEEPVITVPSGNYGNICAGILARCSGLPVKHFIAASNSNNVVANYMKHGQYQAQPTIATISNAMDVGNPSNFVRIMALFQKQFIELKKQMSAFSISDDVTKATIKKVYDQYQYLMDPHTAVAFAAFEQYQTANQNASGIILSTAHPVKFKPIIENILGNDYLNEEEAAILQQAYKTPQNMTRDFDALKSFLLLLQ